MDIQAYWMKHGLISARTVEQKWRDDIMSDFINRQAAIDALGEKPLAWTEGEYELGLQNQWQSDVDALNGLPPAQPTIIHCSECVYYGRADKRRFYRGYDCLDGRIASIVPDRDFCSRAERREE